MSGLFFALAILLLHRNHRSPQLLPCFLSALVYIDVSVVRGKFVLIYDVRDIFSLFYGCLLHLVSFAPLFLARRLFSFLLSVACPLSSCLFFVVMVLNPVCCCWRSASSPLCCSCCHLPSSLGFSMFEFFGLFVPILFRSLRP